MWEQLRLGNLIALRNAEAGTAIYEGEGAFLVRTHGSGMSRLFWLLNECKELAMLPVVKDLVIDQCGFGAASRKTADCVMPGYSSGGSLHLQASQTDTLG